MHATMYSKRMTLGIRKGVADTHAIYLLEIKNLEEQIKNLTSGGVRYFGFDPAQDGANQTVVATINTPELTDEFTVPEFSDSPDRFDRASRPLDDMVDALMYSRNSYFGAPAPTGSRALEGVCTAVGKIRRKKRPKPTYYRSFCKKY